MKQVIKKQGRIVQAYRLGDEGPVVQKLIDEGKIKKLSDDLYEIFSQEAVNGNGELAFSVDYVKLDSTGTPYPNGQEFFLKNHIHIQDDDYEQIPKPLYAWEVSDGMCKEIEYLISEKGLVISPAQKETYYSAPLWGTLLSAAEDAVIIFYDIRWDADGNVVLADFNFVARSEFEQTYDYC